MDRIRELDAVIAENSAPASAAESMQLARALVSKGCLLQEEPEHQGEALACFDRAIEVCNGLDGDTSQLLAEALGNKGWLLGYMGDYARCIGVLDELVALFEEAPDPVLREHVALALNSKALALSRLGFRDERTALYERLVAEYSTDASERVREIVSYALVTRANALRERGDDEAAWQVLDEVDLRLKSEPQTAWQDETVATSLAMRGGILWRRGDTEGAIGVYGALISRFRESANLVIRNQLAGAMCNCAACLESSRDYGAALRLYDEFLSEFGDGESAPIDQCLAQARERRRLLAAR